MISIGVAQPGDPTSAQNHEPAIPLRGGCGNRGPPIMLQWGASLPTSTSHHKAPRNNVTHGPDPPHCECTSEPAMTKVGSKPCHPEALLHRVQPWYRLCPCTQMQQGRPCRGLMMHVASSSCMRLYATTICFGFWIPSFCGSAPDSVRQVTGGGIDPWGGLLTTPQYLTPTAPRSLTHLDNLSPD